MSRCRDSSHAEFVTLATHTEFVSHRRLTSYLKAQSARKLEYRSNRVRGPCRSTVCDSSTRTGDSYTIEGPGGHASRNHNPQETQQMGAPHNPAVPLPVTHGRLSTQYARARACCRYAQQQYGGSGGMESR